MPIRSGATLSLVAVAALSAERASGVAPVSFRLLADRLEVRVADRRFATYVFDDDAIPRPYFAHVHAPNGVRVTRNHPPIPGRDATDHATYHPGIWLAFGDLDGEDFWRNRAKVVHERFLEPPSSSGPGRGGFRVRNRYLTPSGSRTICHEECRFTIQVRPQGYLLIWDSTFRAIDKPLIFGDQEEMGLGIRMATALTVREGGRITNSEGGVNESGVWGRSADWCDYSGTVGQQRVGVTLMPHPDNFRRSWFHARDYGLLVANPFGRHAFRHGAPSQIVVTPNNPFRLRFGIWVHIGSQPAPVDAAASFRDFLEQTRNPTP